MKYKDKECKVYWTKHDRYGRVIGTLWVDSVNINLELVREGLAWHYVKYSSDTILGGAEFDARSKGRGLWNDDGAVAPWEWRKIQEK